MTLYRKVQAVERVFKQLEKDLASFQNATNLRCFQGCGRCCTTPNITATTLEFIPLAYHLHKQGLAIQWYQKLSVYNVSNCFAFNHLVIEGIGGNCGQYNYRGLICRLFGFSAMRDKYGTAQLVTCKTLKEGKTQEYQVAQQHISSGKPAPLMSNYYYQIQSIDGNLGSKLLPINMAMKEALKVVLSYYAYRRPRSA
ncbi:YkgJ family cysteine cluster protein [Aegicerativicinus sediminis]|uniref:YkgJ family cysteine cluster protein n=1 Tax=Aegicerativicinus sediminis TaxID=2893202 RepID=UPI001E3A454F|nr:YkgJ family cysteine cluster protein [Aegicerativicinus sediminis]